MEKVKTTYPTKKEMNEIKERDKVCVYCRKLFDENNRPTREHLNHRKDWDSVGDFHRAGKSVAEIFACCCRSCNFNRSDSSLREWFKKPYCCEGKNSQNKIINIQTVAQVVRNYIDKYEK